MTNNATDNSNVTPDRWNMIELDGPVGVPTTDAPADEVAAESSAPVVPSTFAAIADDSARMAAVPARASSSYLTAEQRAEIRTREGVAFPPVIAPAPVAAPIPAMLSGAQMIAGAAAEGEAVLCGWDGSGELTRGVVAERVTVANMPLTILPAAKSARGQAGRAIAEVCGSKYDYDAEKRSDVEGERPYAARWMIGTTNHGGAIGDSYGRIVATVTLNADATLAIESEDSDLADDIRAEYQRRVDAEVYNSADITAWLRSVLCNVLGGAKIGGVYYVPRGGAALAEALCASMRQVWGTNWIAPALPVATTEQLRRGIVGALEAEADEVIRDYETQRDDAKLAHAEGARKSESIGPRAAGTLLSKLRNVAERSVAYGQLLGSELVAPIRAKLNATMEQVIALLDETSQRAVAIWEEIERDVAAVS